MTGRRSTWIGLDHELEMLEMRGDWMRVRVRQPAWTCVGSERPFPLDLQLDRTLPALPLVSDLLIQLLLNLLSNAIDACADGAGDGCITVSTREVTGRAVMEVADNGHGMSPEELARAGDSYFTTKPEGEGLGLGLALCRSPATELKAELEIDSELGKGTRVHLVFQPSATGEGDEPS